MSDTSETSKPDPQDGAGYFREYANAAGLKERDMPNPHHPLLENDEEIDTLADLVDVRSNPGSGMDAVSRTTAGAPGDDPDPDDDSYMRRDDFVDSMLASDPDGNAGSDRDETLDGGSPLNRAPDMTGTVTGLARGTATHLPQDIGADGFQIVEPEQIDAGLLAAPDDQHQASDVDEDEDGERIPITNRSGAIESRDDALDATRTLR